MTAPYDCICHTSGKPEMFSYSQCFLHISCPKWSFSTACKSKTEGTLRAFENFAWIQIDLRFRNLSAAGIRLCYILSWLFWQYSMFNFVTELSNNVYFMYSSVQARVNPVFLYAVWAHCASKFRWFFKTLRRQHKQPWLGISVFLCQHHSKWMKM